MIPEIEEMIDVINDEGHVVAQWAASLRPMLAASTLRGEKKSEAIAEAREVITRVLQAYDGIMLALHAEHEALRALDKTLNEN